MELTAEYTEISASNAARLRAEGIAEAERLGIEAQLRQVSEMMGTRMARETGFDRTVTTMQYLDRVWQIIVSHNRDHDVALYVNDVPVFHSIGHINWNRPAEPHREIIGYRPGPWAGQLLDLIEEARRRRQLSAIHAGYASTERMATAFAPVEL